MAVSGATVVYGSTGYWFCGSVWGVWLHSTYATQKDTVVGAVMLLTCDHFYSLSTCKDREISKLLFAQFK